MSVCMCVVSLKQTSRSFGLDRSAKLKVRRSSFRSPAITNRNNNSKNKMPKRRKLELFSSSSYRSVAISRSEGKKRCKSKSRKTAERGLTGLSTTSNTRKKRQKHKIPIHKYKKQQYVFIQKQIKKILYKKKREDASFQLKSIIWPRFPFFFIMKFLVLVSSKTA